MHNWHKGFLLGGPEDLRGWPGKGGGERNRQNSMTMLQLTTPSDVRLNTAGNHQVAGGEDTGLFWTVLGQTWTGLWPRRSAIISNAQGRYIGHPLYVRLCVPAGMVPGQQRHDAQVA